MKDAFGIIIGERGKHLHLLRIEATERDLDAHHSRCIPERVRTLVQFLWELERPCLETVMTLAVVVTLAIDAAAEAGLRKDLLINLSLTAELHLTLEYVNLAFEMRQHRVGQTLLPGEIGRASCRERECMSGVSRTVAEEKT